MQTEVLNPVYQAPETLIEKLKNSDECAFEQLFSQYQPLLFKYIYYKTNDYDLATDIVQDTFIKVWTSRSTLKTSHSFYAFLCKISRNLLMDHYKHLQVREKHKDNVPIPSWSYNDNPEQALDYKTRLEQIHHIAKYHLSENYRSAFFLSRIEGKSNSEIAELMNVSVKKVENYLYNALKKLSKKLK